MSTSTNPPPHCDPDELPRWTIERMERFIGALQRTRNVAAAARAAGMSRQAAYRLRARLAGHPFDRAWAAAMAPREVFRRMVAASQGVTGGDTGLRRMTGDDGR